MDDNQRTFLKTLNEQTVEDSSAESLLARKKLYIIAVGLVCVLASIIGIWFMIRSTRTHHRYENELIQKIMDTYGVYLTYDKKKSRDYTASNNSNRQSNGQVPVETVVLVLEQDVSGLPQGLTALCNDYFSDPSKVYPVQIWVCVPQNRNYRTVFGISNYCFEDETLHHEIVTLLVGDDVGYGPGSEYYTLKNYIGIPDIRYLYIGDDEYYSSVAQDAVDMDMDFDSMEWICVRGTMNLYSDYLEVSDDVRTAQVIDEPQQVTIKGTKATVVLRPEDYEISWNKVWNFDPAQPVYDYKIRIYQDSIYELQDEIGYIKDITFQ